MENLDLYLDENLSSFEGDQDIYTGEGDDFLNFAGAHNFAQEMDASRVFVVNFTNNTLKSSKKISILKGYDDGNSLGAKVIDGPNVFRGTTSNGEIEQEDGNKAGEGSASESFVASGSPDTILALQEFVKNVPSNLVGLRIQADNPAQLQGVIQFIEKSPFHTNESKDLFLGTYVNENTYKDNIVTVPTPGVILGPETEMLFDLVAGANVSITFFVGAVLSTTSALKKKRNRAVAHIKRVGLPLVRQKNIARNLLNR